MTNGQAGQTLYEMPNLRWILKILLCCCLALPLAAQEILETPVGLVQVHSLPCGARALLQPLAQRPVALTLVLPWGRNHTPAATPALVDMVARLMARSSPAYPQGTLLVQLESVGGKASYRVGERFTALTLEVPSAQAVWALEVQLDRLRGGWLKGEDLQGLPHLAGVGPLEIDTFVLQHLNPARAHLAMVGGFDGPAVSRLLAESKLPEGSPSQTGDGSEALVPPQAGAFRAWPLETLPPGGWAVAAMLATSPDTLLEPLEDHLWQREPAAPPALPSPSIQQQAVERWVRAWDDLGSRSLWLAGLHARNPALLGTALRAQEILWGDALARFPQDSAFLQTPFKKAEGQEPVWQPAKAGRKLKPVKVAAPPPAAATAPPPFVRLEPHPGCSALVQSLDDLPAVAVRAYLPGGSSLDSASQAGRAEWLGACWQVLLSRHWTTRVNTQPQGWTFSAVLPSAQARAWLTAWFGCWLNPQLEAAVAEDAWSQLSSAGPSTALEQAYQDWLEALYPVEHPLGRRPLQVRPALERVQELAAEVARRGRWNLFLSGDVPLASVQAALDEARPPSPDPSLPSPWESLPTREALPTAPIRCQGSVSRATLLVGGYGPSRREPDFYAFVLALQALAGDPLRGRLQSELRFKQGLVQRVESSFLSSNSAAPFLLQIECSAEQVQRVQEQLDRELTAFGRSELSRAELERLVARMEGLQQLSQGGAEGRLQQLRNIELFHLSDSYTQGFAGIYRRITPKDVMLVARRRLAPAQMVKVVLTPSS